MKKIKNNSKGFVLAETLIVTVFVMWIFTLIYSGIYPLVGEFEKRENYDDIDSKYGAYLVKKLIEDQSYQLAYASDEDMFFKSYKFIRFECSTINDEDKKNVCINTVKNLEIDGCDNNGNNCEIYITTYKLDDYGSFRLTVTNNGDFAIKKYRINCFVDCKTKYLQKCTDGLSNSEAGTICDQQAEKNAFSKGFREYVKSLPNFSAGSLNSANYRVIVAYHHQKNNNDYYTYATIEVNK